MEEILAAIKHIMAEEGVMPMESTASSSAAEKPASPPIADEKSAASEAPIHLPDMSASTKSPKGALPSSDASVPPRLPPVQDAILDLTERIDEDESPAKPIPRPSSTPSFAAGRLNRPPPLKSVGMMGDSAGRRILSDATLAASVASLSQVASAAAARKQQELALGDVSRTLEEMVRDLLRPALKEWLDANLPKLVERLLRDEISRLVREAEMRS
ncbi:MAG: DUF2497 domain-containing protein [Stellaceae bacterium]